MGLENVPMVDFALWKSPLIEDKKRFLDELCGAFVNIGFAVLVNHGIPESLINASYNYSRQVFAYPDDVLRKYETPQNGRQTGFTSTGIEHAKTSGVPDLKRFWHIRCDDVPGVIKTPWPEEVPEFKVVGRALFEELYELSLEIGRALERILFCSGIWFSPKMIGKGETLLRILHYPPVKDNVSGVRAHEHEDINLFTLLVSATDSGLEVKTKKGVWVPVNERLGSIVVNVGDMLQMYTRGLFVSTSHRVVNPDNSFKDRYSAPFFVHPKNDMVLDRKTGMTAGQYLRERLLEIGLKK